MSTTTDWMTGVGTVMLGVGTLALATPVLLPYLNKRRKLKRPRSEETKTEGTETAPPEPDRSGGESPARSAPSAWWSVGSGQAAWGLALLVVVLVAFTNLQRLLLVLIIIVWALSVLAVVSGVLALGKAGPDAGLDLRLRAQSGLIGAVGAVTAMLIIIVLRVIMNLIAY
jgi:hypothetical protein